jgi:hypothetical protein
MILPKVRDPRFITLRRGGTLTDADHRLLALWAASCAEHVLPLFESARPDDPRPRAAIDHARAWVRGEVKMMEARSGHRLRVLSDTHQSSRAASGPSAHSLTPWLWGGQVGVIGHGVCLAGVVEVVSAGSFTAAVTQAGIKHEVTTREAFLERLATAIDLIVC